MKYERKDKFFNMAKQTGYRARSSFKLLEIQEKYNLIKKDSKVLDIGCAPGSWLQVVKKFSQAETVGVDLVSIKPINGVRFVKGDIEKEEIVEELGTGFDVVLSDIAPKTSGNRERDQYISYELSRKSFLIAKKFLKKGGDFVVKTFQSQDTEELVKEIKGSFEFVKRYTPKSVREGSKEVYIIGLKFKS